MHKKLQYISKPPFNPSETYKFKLSLDVWYSGYSPYLDLINETTGKSINGLQNCLSSLPLSRKLYFFVCG